MKTAPEKPTDGLLYFTDVGAYDLGTVFSLEMKLFHPLDDPQLTKKKKIILNREY